MRILICLGLFSLFLFLTGCRAKQMNKDSSAWAPLTTKKIYFGHQSVGYNIVDGIRDVTKMGNGAALNIVESRDPAVFASPVFAHSRTGANLDPRLKCRDFEAAIDGGIGNRVDYAFLKFCYVDVTSKTDVKDVFSEYRDMMNRLQAKYPQTTFVAMTVPLTYQKTGIKTWIKSVIGKKDIWEYEDNMRRAEFNELVRKELADTPLFDLASVESNGESVKAGGREFSAMTPEYTDDGGHLNAKGRVVVAESLLSFLANLQ